MLESFSSLSSCIHGTGWCERTWTAKKGPPTWQHRCERIAVDLRGNSQRHRTWILCLPNTASQSITSPSPQLQPWTVMDPACAMASSGGSGTLTGTEPCPCGFATFTRASFKLWGCAGGFAYGSSFAGRRHRLARTQNEHLDTKSKKKMVQRNLAVLILPMNGTTTFATLRGTSMVLGCTV